MSKFDIDKVAIAIHQARYDACDMRLDGWTCFESKKDLYQIKWLVEDALRKCPTFVGEEEWIKEQEKKRIIEILKK